ncbi:hypothetical protein EV652_102551 [Kribbella steppae]|uniref:Uncharacterized protein n=1 Tax=Kribbella steppae TaxID=2512223 RepID=A0A4R2HWP4_9ACTN|nr:hypothetical protein EV652_102551 [Kribbella steppae]
MVAAVAGLVLTGCGSESDGGSGGTPSSTPTPTMPTVTQSTPVGTGLPLVVTRTGGFAGFDDKVVIDTDGVATVSSRGKETVRCKLDQSLLATITAAAQQVDWASLPVVKPTVRHPDDMIVAVTANGKTARLEEPRVKAMTAPVTTLLTEAAIPPGKLCKPV